MATKQQNEAASLYAALMDELKLRIIAIDAATGGKLQFLSPQIIREFCFLQIRLLCEVIALACLVAHGDLKQTKKLKKEWAADKIMDELAKLRPEFFPIPCVFGKRTVTGLPKDELAKRLTREGLADLYVEANRIIHRGNVKNLLKQKEPVRVHYPEITARVQKIVDLMQSHLIAIEGGNLLFLCGLHILGEKTGRVQVAIAGKTEVQPPKES